MKEVRVGSWRELEEHLFENAWQEGLERLRSPYAFCGLPDAAYDLTTTLIRLGGAYEKQEQHLLRNFRKYAPEHTVEHDSIWDWLALGQHHGLPTRLLDWTYSPYVALHFATQRLSLFHRDAVLWCVNYRRTNELLPDQLQALLHEEGAEVFTAEMLCRAAHSLAEFDRLADGEFVVFFEPPSLDARIVNQYALFSLMSSPTARLDHWLRQRPDLCRRIILPAALKWEVRDRLDQANITERVLFPGLDGLSRWLRRYYSPRSADRPGRDADRGR
jgi:hypothetical protein